MTDPYLGQVQLFGFNFAPQGWAQCQGQILPISQYVALFSIIGTFYGGNGTSNFALPNLQGNSVVGAGQAPGLSPYVVGEIVGTPTVTIDSSTMARHNHGLVATSVVGTKNTASGNQLALAVVSGGGSKGSNGYTNQIYSPNASQATTGLAPQAIGMTGGSQPHNNMQPYLALNYCIALNGVFPPRN